MAKTYKIEMEMEVEWLTRLALLASLTIIMFLTSMAFEGFGQVAMLSGSFGFLASLPMLMRLSGVEAVSFCILYPSFYISSMMLSVEHLAAERVFDLFNL